MDILICWIGNADLQAAEKNEKSNWGPIAQALKVGQYELAVLLDNYNNERVERYQDWLAGISDCRFEVHPVKLSGPTNHKDIYEAVRGELRDLKHSYPDAVLTFHISPGTPAMAQVWMLLAPAYGAKVIESSIERGVQPVNFPFEISACFLPDRDLARLAENRAPLNPAFKDIVGQSTAIRYAVQQATRLASRDVTILIEGESGTGKELFARAVHQASNRAAGPFIPVNCGAIPSELVESQLFGHKKGAFTGAAKDSPGYFKAADNGTLFLDELGELPSSAQVKLLRALEERAVVPVGGTSEEEIDVRIIAATNKNLLEEVTAGRFRSDLFYRLAVGILHLPPLRERGEDVELLIDNALNRVNGELSKFGGIVDKKISDSAKKIMANHLWPGNVRELHNTIMRAALWSPDEIIDTEAAKESILFPPKDKISILDRPIGDGFSLEKLLGQVAAHYLDKAMVESAGTKAKAAKLLGFKNYQTLSNWLDRYCK